MHATHQATEWLRDHDPGAYATLPAASPAASSRRVSLGRLPAATPAQATRQALEWLRQHDPDTYAWTVQHEPFAARVAAARVWGNEKTEEYATVSTKAGASWSAGQVALAGVVGIAVLVGRAWWARPRPPRLALAQGPVIIPSWAMT
jgi:prephenate dehydratase